MKTRPAPAARSAELEFPSAPAAAGATKTSGFLTHWRGRVALSSAAPKDRVGDTRFSALSDSTTSLAPTPLIVVRHYFQESAPSVARGDQRAVITKKSRAHELEK